MLVVLLASCFLACHGYQVCIAPKSGIQKSPSYCESTTTINDFCHHANAMDNGVSNTVVTVLIGTHMLNRTCEFHHVNNLTLRGESQSKTIVQSFHFLENTGFIFLNVSTLRISDIQFRFCRANWTFTINRFPHVSKEALSALLFINGSSLILRNVAVFNSKTAAFHIRNVVGRVSIDSCEFASDDLRSNGNIVEYYPFIAENTNLTIVGTFVLRNQQRLTSATSAGIAIILQSSKVTVNIAHCSLSGNAGQRGGNMAVTLFDFASVTISHTNFEYGYSMYGGGLYVLFGFSLSDDKTSSSVNTSRMFSIVNSSFSYNKASLGGGVAFQSFQQNATAYAHLSNSSFDYNTGISGMGVFYSVVNDIQNFSPMKFLYLIVSNCHFSNHFQPRNTKLGSVIALYDVPYFGVESIIADSNLCSVIFAVNSKIVFYGSTMITNNSAVTGTGFQLANSYLLLTPHTNVIVTHNSALEQGGGILIQDYDSCTSIKSFNCNFQLSADFEHDVTLLQTTNFTISNNKAFVGDNIFGGDSCYGESSSMNAVIHIPKNTIHQNSSISSNPEQVCIGIRECDSYVNLTVYPGQRVTIPIHVVGERQGSVPGTVKASGSAIIKPGERAQEFDLSGKNITYTVYSSHFNHSKARIYLQPVKKGCNEPEHGIRSLIELSFVECPFGFLNTNIGQNMFECQCVSSPTITDCSLGNYGQSQAITITKRKSSWIGMFELDNHPHLATNDYCPLDYCYPHFQDIKTYSDHLDQDEQCRYNRTQILCGSCPEGWSLVLGSSECREKCSNVWLLLILPFALAGLLLVAVIHFLNLTVTMGTVCGLIFYANILQDHFVTLLSTNPVPGLTPILQVFLSWLNLDLGISTCFYDGMEAFGKTILLFAFPGYIWVISAIIVILSNRYISFTRLIGESAAKVLATLFLLSYSKILRVTIGSLNLKIVNIHFANDSTVTKVRWIVDGNIPYFDPQRHLILFVIAIVFVMMLLPFTMSLLCIRHVHSLSNCCRVFSWIDKLKPFFDTYTGPYKDNARFWTGLLLLIRLFLLIVNAVDYKDHVVPYYIIIAFLLLLTALMILFRGVYLKHGLNVLECYFIFNLIAIFQVNTYKGGPNSWKSIFTHILVSSAFLTFLGILAYHVYLKLFHLLLLNRASQTAHHDYEGFNYERENNHEPVQQVLSNYSESTPLIQACSK